MMNEYEALGQPVGGDNPFGNRPFQPYMVLKGDALYEAGSRVPDDRAVAALETYIARMKRALATNMHNAKVPEIGQLAQGVADYDTRPQIVNAMKILEHIKAKRTLEAERAAMRAKSGAR